MMTVFKLNREVACRFKKSSLRSYGCHSRTPAGYGNDHPRAFSGNKGNIEKLWHEFFADPSQWWDHRSEKVNARYPDFKHKKTQDALWIDGKLNPPWVEPKLAAIVPGTLELSSFSWNSRLAAYVKSRQHEKTVQLYQQMQQEGMIPNKFTFVPVLNACANLRDLNEGRRIHMQILETGCESDPYVSCSLVDMYAKCGSIEDAWTVFNKMPAPNVVSWNAMILGCVKCGQENMALKLHQRMQREGVVPVPLTFVGLLNACANLGALEEGKSIHEQIIQKGWDSHVYVGNTLLHMYAKCGSMDDAWGAFNNMPARDVVAWNVMILAYVKCGQGQKALDLSHQMQEAGLEPAPISFVAFLNACASVGALDEGRRVHEQIIQRGYESNVFVGSSLVDMYAKCGSIEDAWRVFDKMPARNAVTWNALIQGYVKCGKGERALELFRQMQQDGVDTVPTTFVLVLNACASVGAGALEEGRCVHEQIIQRHYESEDFVGNSLVDMYAKCGGIEEAWRVFDSMPKRDVVSWNSMIQGYANCGQGKKALELSHQMQQEGVDPVTVTFVGMLNACASIAALDEGRQIHQQIMNSSCEMDVFVGNSLVDMYAKCGSIEDALRVFYALPVRNVVGWNTVIQGCVKCGQGLKALELYHQMQQEGVELVPVTFVGALNACASVGDLEEGRSVHRQIIQNGYESDAFVGNSLVNMYGKCKSVEDAWNVFKNMPVHDVIAWNALILGYVKCGDGQKALQLCQQMQQEGVEPDHVSFVGFLSACASASALEDGRRVHNEIIQRGYELNTFVSSSLIDMYAKCGSIDDAWRVFDRIPKDNVVSWNAMLAGYGSHGHAKKALAHFEHMFAARVEMDMVTFVSLLSVCSHAGLVEEGLHYLESITSVYRVSATVEHCACMVDLLGRAGRLHEAEDLIITSSCESEVTVWMSLLGAARVHGNVEMGERVAKEVLELDPVNSAGHVLLSNIYAAAGNWDSCVDVQRERLGCMHLD